MQDSLKAEASLSSYLLILSHSIGVSYHSLMVFSSKLATDREGMNLFCIIDKGRCTYTRANKKVDLIMNTHIGSVGRSAFWSCNDG